MYTHTHISARAQGEGDLLTYMGPYDLFSWHQHHCLSLFCVYFNILHNYINGEGQKRNTDPFRRWNVRGRGSSVAFPAWGCCHLFSLLISQHTRRDAKARTWDTTVWGEAHIAVLFFVFPFVFCLGFSAQSTCSVVSFNWFQDTHT